ncbi:MAG TPA: hypothetical protein VGE97_07560 [Nitrososphaera sp.]
MKNWHAVPSFNNEIGVVKSWREVGIALHNISYEYLVMFQKDGPYFWIPERYLVPVE